MSDVTLPEVVDDENDSVAVEVSGLPDFVQFEDMVLYAGADCEYGTFEVTIELTDDKGEAQTYNFNLVFAQ